MTYSANMQFISDLPGVDLRTLYLSLDAAACSAVGPLASLPRSLKVLAEGILHRLPLEQAKIEIDALRSRDQRVSVSFAPGRALLQDFMGIPLMTDMAAMRDTLAARGVDPRILDPVIPVDFVVDHSLTVLDAGSRKSLEINRTLEMERNRERFSFIKWCQGSFGNFRVIPPGRGIMHQVNLEWLSQIVTVEEHEHGERLARPDTMIGTDSHTTMVNALGVLGWGIGGIEAEMAMLGTPLEMRPPRVVGVRLTGHMRAGVTATDLVLHITEALRRINVVGAFVEFFGEGVGRLPLADRATIANMSPEFGATCTYFPIDRLTVNYLRMTGRSDAHVQLVEAYARAQGLWQDDDDAALDFDSTLEFDLSSVEPSMAGPTRPDERVALGAVSSSFHRRLKQLKIDPREKSDEDLGHGSIVIAAITSCTNTSNPAVMMAAGLLARNAAERGLRPKSWVKTSMAPGSRVVSDYLSAAGLTPYLEMLGFHNVGYGCATCNGNSGPLADTVRKRIDDERLCAVAVLSGNRNFEGRIHPQVQAAYLASPPLVIAAAIAGTIDTDLAMDPLGHDETGQPVHLADIWPRDDEIQDYVGRHVTGDLFRASYNKQMETTSAWSSLASPEGSLFAWEPESQFVRPSPFPTLGPAADFTGRIVGVRPLIVLGDAVTTDHISPNGAIHADSPAGIYLRERGIDQGKLGNFGARRGNPEVCARGMFDNPLLENEIMCGRRGNLTRVAGFSESASIHDAAAFYRRNKVATLIVAGRNYGAGSSRDWAAKGLRTLGVITVLAESFERIHRSNLVGMGVLPICFPEGMSRAKLALTGAESIDLDLSDAGLSPHAFIRINVRRVGREDIIFDGRLQVFSEAEIRMIALGGVLPSIVAQLTQEAV